MNRAIVILIVLVVSVGVAIGVTIYLQSKRTGAIPDQQTQAPSNTLPNIPAPSSSADSHSKEEVRATYQKAIIGNKDNIKLYDTAISGIYAIQVWKGAVTGGEALLMYSTAKQRWVVLGGGGGAWSVEGLIGKGVSPADAAALRAALPH
jgi:hypothetical protein